MFDTPNFFTFSTSSSLHSSCFSRTSIVWLQAAYPVRVPMANHKHSVALSKSRSTHCSIFNSWHSPCVMSVPFLLSEFSSSLQNIPWPQNLKISHDHLWCPKEPIENTSFYDALLIRFFLFVFVSVLLSFLNYNVLQVKVPSTCFFRTFLQWWAYNWSFSVLDDEPDIPSIVLSSVRHCAKGWGVRWALCHSSWKPQYGE